MWICKIIRICMNTNIFRIKIRKGLKSKDLLLKERIRVATVKKRERERDY